MGGLRRIIGKGLAGAAEVGVPALLAIEEQKILDGRDEAQKQFQREMASERDTFQTSERLAGEQHAATLQTERLQAAPGRDTQTQNIERYDEETGEEWEDVYERSSDGIWVHVIGRDGPVNVNAGGQESGGIPQGAIDLLLGDPSDSAIAEFNAEFGKDGEDVATGYLPSGEPDPVQSAGSGGNRPIARRPSNVRRGGGQATDSMGRTIPIEPRPTNVVARGLSSDTTKAVEFVRSYLDKGEFPPKVTRIQRRDIENAMANHGGKLTPEEVQSLLEYLQDSDSTPQASTVLGGGGIISNLMAERT